MSLFRRDQGGDTGLPWAAGGEQPRLDDEQNVMDRLTPIQLTPATWGDDLRARRLPQPKEQGWYVGWAVGLGLAAAVGFVFGLYWTGAALLLLAGWVLVLFRFPRIPRWTWALVLVVDILFVAPFDLLDRSPTKPRHPAHHAVSVPAARHRDGRVQRSGDELGKL